MNSWTKAMSKGEKLKTALSYGSRSKQGYALLFKKVLLQYAGCSINIIEF